MKVQQNQEVPELSEQTGGMVDGGAASTSSRQYWWGGLFLLFGIYMLGSYLSAGPAMDGEEGRGIGDLYFIPVIAAGVYFILFGKNFFSKQSETLEYFEAISMAVGIAFTVRAFVVEPFKIPSGSMIPTLLVGDYLFVSKSAYGYRLPFTHTRIFMGEGPERGDVAVFEYPRDPSKDYIKRIIGLPGDHIVYRGKRLYINNNPIEYQPQGGFEYKAVQGNEVSAFLLTERLEEVSHPILLQPSPYLDNYTDRVVEPGHYFVMGDNRDNSNDSRVWGFVPAHRLVGKAQRIFWSWDMYGEGFSNSVRWDRIWNPVK